MVNRRGARGTTFLEYAMLFLAVAAGLLAMNRFIAGAVGGVARQASDTFGSGQQYDEPFLALE